MKKIIQLGALVALGGLCAQGTTFAHGGTYRGPGDTVPPGGGGGGGGGSGGPGPAGPTAPGPSGPGTPGPNTPAGGPSSAGPGNRPSTGPGNQQQDLTLWQFWWGFNKDPYLNLKQHVHSAAVSTGSDEFFLGTGERPKAKDTFRPSEETIRSKVVPALVHALQNERSDHILTGCMVALAKIGDAKREDGKSEMAEHIKPFLASKSAEVSETAAVALGILSNDAPETIDLLAQVLADDSAKVRDQHKVALNGEIALRMRAFAAYGLGLIGYKSNDEAKRQDIVNTLAKMLDKSERTSSRDIPVACLTAIGLVALPYDPNDDVIKGAKAGEIKTRNDQLRFLLEFFKDDNQEFLNRAHSPIAMARLMAEVPQGSKLRAEIVQALCAPLKKDGKAQDEIRQSCAMALGQIGDCDGDALDSEIRKVLLATQTEIKDQQSQYFAMVSAAQVGGRPGTGEGDPLAGAKDVRKWLTDLLSKGKGQQRSWAGLSIGVMERALDDNRQASSAEMRKAVASALADTKSPTEIGAFSISLGLMKDLDSKLVLREKLDKISDNDARGYTAVGLGLMNDAEAVKPITEIIRKSKYQADLLRSAAIGLGLLGDKMIVPELVEMLGDAQGLASQAAIASALGFIGDTRSIDPLVAFIDDKDKTDHARGFAAAALGIVADKEMLPWNSKISCNMNYRANTPTLTAPSEGTGILDIL